MRVRRRRNIVPGPHLPPQRGQFDRKNYAYFLFAKFLVAVKKNTTRILTKRTLNKSAFLVSVFSPRYEYYGYSYLRTRTIRSLHTLRLTGAE